MAGDNIALTDADLQSAAWIKVKAKYEARLESLRKQNDAGGNTLTGFSVI